MNKGFNRLISVQTAQQFPRQVSDQKPYSINDGLAINSDGLPSKFAPEIDINLVSRWYTNLWTDGNGAKKVVGHWFLVSSALVFGIVVLGGLTRLTESGLSMIDWNFIHFVAPNTNAKWSAYFERYKQFPEYQINHGGNLTLDQFKNIYMMEHAHRVYGRLLGLFVIVPGLFFVAYKRGNFVYSNTIRRLIFGCSSLVVFQVSSIDCHKIFKMFP